MSHNVEGRTISTRAALIIVLALIVTAITVSTLLLLRARFQRQIEDRSTQEMTRATEAFANVEEQQLSALRRENALLADLPSLKALMTSGDQRTIADGAVEFYKVSGNDLFALASPNGTVQAAITRDDAADDALRAALSKTLPQTNKSYLLSGQRMFVYAVRPLYFGSEITGTLLGYVISGSAVNPAMLRQISRPSSADAAFISANNVIASTLPIDAKDIASLDDRVTTVRVGNERYLARAHDLSADANVPLRLVVLASLLGTEMEERATNRSIALVGVLAVLSGTVAMFLLAGSITQPIERLTAVVRAFGRGDTSAALPRSALTEVRQLSDDFDRMRVQIQDASQALLNSERLATIGSMATSVSHDLRHYLAAIYANAEFLAVAQLSDTERAELLLDIRAAVTGTTDLLDSLLIFSRTGNSAPRTPEYVSALVDRAAALARSHPDAENVNLILLSDPPIRTQALVEARQIERAVFNLMLNACQSAGRRGQTGEVTVETRCVENVVYVRVTDNGDGVPHAIRDQLFEPFVSNGKHNGTGLGLTMAKSVAREHGGDVVLEESISGRTTFRMTLSNGLVESEDVMRDAEVDL